MTPNNASADPEQAYIIDIRILLLMTGYVGTYLHMSSGGEGTHKTRVQAMIREFHSAESQV